MAHCESHTLEARAKMRAAHLGKPAPWKLRATRVSNGETLFRCGSCKEFLARDKFHRSGRVSIGIKSQCKVCHSKCSIASRDPVKKRAATTRSEAARRARKAGVDGTVTANDWQTILLILGDACLCCGETDDLTQDHVVPLSKGGPHHPSNIQPLCRKCNERKQARAFDYRSEEQKKAISVWVVEFRRAQS